MAIFDDFISLKEAGAISGYHPDYIGALVRSNKVKGKKIGKNWFVSKKEVQEYFTTKHYVSAEKVFISGKKVLFFCLILILAGLGGLCAFELSKPGPVPVAVQTSLSDTVGTQADQNNPSADIAQPLPTIGQ